MDRCCIRDTLDAIDTPEQSDPTVLLHGDYWPSNLLWRDGILAAVLDPRIRSAL